MGADQRPPGPQSFFEYYPKTNPYTAVICFFKFMGLASCAPRLQGHGDLRSARVVDCVNETWAPTSGHPVHRAWVPTVLALLWTSDWPTLSRGKIKSYGLCRQRPASSRACQPSHGSYYRWYQRKQVARQLKNRTTDSLACTPGQAAKGLLHHRTHRIHHRTHA